MHPQTRRYIVLIIKHPAQDMLFYMSRSTHTALVRPQASNLPRGFAYTMASIHTISSIKLGMKQIRTTFM